MLVTVPLVVGTALFHCQSSPGSEGKVASAPGATEDWLAQHEERWRFPDSHQLMRVKSSEISSALQHLLSFDCSVLGIGLIWMPELAPDLSRICDSSAVFFLVNLALSWATSVPCITGRSRAVPLNPFVELFICCLLCECLFSHL